MPSKSLWTEKKIAELQSDGFGVGELEAYKPWLEVKSFSSRGRSRRVHSAKTGRVHQLLSDVEYGVFIAAEWSRAVVDIREQFSLDRDKSQRIAQQLGIRHPFYPGTHVPTVMTVDFLLTRIEGGKKSFVALNAKRDEEAEDSNSLEKLEIQRTYFEESDVPHHLIYHSQIPQQKIKNMDWVRDALLKDGEAEPRKGFYADLCPRLAKELASGVDVSLTLAQYCAGFDQRYGIEAGAGLRVARMLIYERSLMVNLDSEDLAREPLHAFLMTARSGQLQAVGARR